MAANVTEWTGRVVDNGGAPVADAAVVVVAGSVPIPELALLSGPDGRFTLRLPPGRFTLRAHGDPGRGETTVDTTALGAEIVIRVG
ncbi:carboxypeptidase regulatory-like domain-containing protein [Paractinoplanes lichenicola]|uniref:Carboxypeptidase regulatory-like domain-containing protein n=1 Tax=Paractinoplanes lichenicola TaxID=2802976 RepID=A0ABS1VND0_9ACTN|nr:carboxypeptidase regulatory-like domain-containing protein [Actinoplanes lichenicola]MBL7255720.1 carboxypeptidase regulatory-like domain-containing protein [Actinoplanes lichenicola]